MKRLNSTGQKRVEKVERPRGLNLSTLPNPPESDRQTGKSDPAADAAKARLRALMQRVAPDTLAFMDAARGRFGEWDGEKGVRLTRLDIPSEGISLRSKPK